MKWLGLIAMAIVVFVALCFILAAGFQLAAGPGYLIAISSSVMGFIVAVAADARGYNPFAWMIYGALIWPVALIHVLVAEKNEAALEARKMQGGPLKKCPQCAEMIKVEAIKCRYCGSNV